MRANHIFFASNTFSQQGISARSALKSPSAREARFSAKPEKEPGWIQEARHRFKKKDPLSKMIGASLGTEIICSSLQQNSPLTSPAMRYAAERLALLNSNRIHYQGQDLSGYKLLYLIAQLEEAEPKGFLPEVFTGQNKPEKVMNLLESLTKYGFLQQNGNRYRLAIPGKQEILSYLGFDVTEQDIRLLESPA